MNKSTPLSQLPSQNSGGSFINDQQKQMFSQAQAAIQSSTFPQNTSLENNVTNTDEDPMVQELLNHFNTK